MADRGRSGSDTSVPEFLLSKMCLLEGVDELGWILKQEEAIRAYEAGRPAAVNTTAGA